VLFGEMLPVDAFDRASEVVADARLLLCAGSSLEVYPVAGLPELVFDAGRPVAICTQGATPYDREARFRSHAPLAELLPAAAAVAVEARTA
jgi:NAD-dependent deacetylase